MSCRRGQVRNRLWYSPDERLPELSAEGGEVVRKVKHSSVRIENPLLALYRGFGFSAEMSTNLAQVRVEPCVPLFRTFAFRRDGAILIFATV